MGGKRCIGRGVEGHEKGGGGGNKVGECKAGRRRNFFLSFIYSVSPLREANFYVCVAQFYTQFLVHNLD